MDTPHSLAARVVVAGRAGGLGGECMLDGQLDRNRVPQLSPEMVEQGGDERGLVLNGATEPIQVSCTAGVTAQGKGRAGDGVNQDE